MRRNISENIVSARSPKDSEPIYKLALHEIMMVEIDVSEALTTSVMRVPGGWIYRSYDKSNKMMSTTFVPYNNEYQTSI